MNVPNTVAITKERLVRINGIGPETSEKLVKALEKEGIMNFEQLKEAIDNDSVLQVKGVGPTLQQSIEQYINQNPDAIKPQQAKEAGTEWPWRSGKFWGWFVSVLVLAIVANTLVLSRVQFIGVSVTALISLLIIYLWGRFNWTQVGDEEVSAQGVQHLFFKPRDVKDVGRHFLVRPFEGFKQFPKIQYEMYFDYNVYTKEGENEDQEQASQPVEGEVIVYMNFPNLNEEYHYPMPKEEAKRRAVEYDPIDGEYVNRDQWVWGKITGKELLLTRTYPRLPVANPMEVGTVDKLGEHFEGGVIGAVRSVFQKSTTETVKEEVAEIEEGIKNYLLVEEGNPAYEIGIPRENLDIEVNTSQFDEDFEQSVKDVEIAENKSKAAEHEAEAIERRGEAYKNIGVSADLAGMLSSGGIEGKPLDLDQWRDVGITRAMVQGSKGIPKEKLEEMDKILKNRGFTDQERKDVLNDLK